MASELLRTRVDLIVELFERKLTNKQTYQIAMSLVEIRDGVAVLDYLQDILRGAKDITPKREVLRVVDSAWYITLLELEERQVPILQQSLRLEPFGLPLIRRVEYDPEEDVLLPQERESRAEREVRYKTVYSYFNKDMYTIATGYKQ